MNTHSKILLLCCAALCGCVGTTTNENSGAATRGTFAAYDGVQLWQDGPSWATTNIGAEKPEDYGYYFWWGDTVGYKREGNAWVATDGSSSNFQFYNDPISYFRRYGGFSDRPVQGVTK